MKKEKRTLKIFSVGHELLIPRRFHKSMLRVNVGIQYNKLYFISLEFLTHHGAWISILRNLLGVTGKVRDVFRKRSQRKISLDID